MKKENPKLHDPVQLLPDEAKPCPWCGEQPDIQRWHGGGPQKRMIGCQSIFCEVSPEVTGGTRKSALAHWNERRVP